MTIEEAITWFTHRVNDAKKALEAHDRYEEPGGFRCVAKIRFETANMALSALRAQQEAERNEPLTLAEAQLLIQNQEPVWRSGLTLRDASSKWKIARFCTGEYVSWQDGASDRFENYGISWLAYRRPTVGEGAEA